MTTANQAVFISYASEDVDVAEGIAEALRTAGIEVWFDKNELVGGDAWDAKIRRQIKECTLFVPIISANTQARAEGYFRLEWHLAEQRTYLMAHDQPFLFPVVIDDTSDAEARVPDRFRERQWMRLESTTPEAIAQRVAAALSGDPAPSSSPPVPVRPTPAIPAKNPRKVITYLSAAIGIFLFAWFFLRPMWWSKIQSLEPETAATTTTTDPEVAQLLTQAREAFYHHNATRHSFALAERLLNRADEMAPDSSEVMAVRAVLHCLTENRGYDKNTEHLRLAEDLAAQALLLNPREPEALFTQGLLLDRLGREPDHARRLIEAAYAGQPDNVRIIIELARNHVRSGRLHDAIDLLAREADRFPTNPEIPYYASLFTFWDHDPVLSNQWSDRSLAIEPFWRALVVRAMSELYMSGDPDDMTPWLEMMPEDHRSDLRVLWLRGDQLRRKRDGAGWRGLLAQITTDYIEDNVMTGPKSMLVAQAFELEGKTDRAQQSWATAEAELRQHMSENGMNFEGRAYLALALVAQGRRAEAATMASNLRDDTEITLTDPNRYPYRLTRLAAVFTRLGDAEAAVDLLRQSQTALGYGGSSRAMLRQDPEWDPIRNTPEFQELLAEDPESPRFVRQSLGDGEIPPKSIAVLPFANRSASADDAFFVDGVHDDLITHISRIKDLKSIARSSVMGYRDTAKPLGQIGRELGVATVLQGGVQRAGNRVRINVQLSDAATDDHLWAETFTRELTAENIFEIQTEIATAVAEALQIVLSSTAQQQFAKLPTENLAALEAYFRGKQELEKYTSESLLAAQPHYEEAIRLDPDFADAYAGLARVHTHFVWFNGFPESEHHPIAKELIDHALELNPDLPNAWIELGIYAAQQGSGFHAQAEEAFIRAIELGPSQVDAYKGYGGFLQWQKGDLPQAVAVLRKAAEVDPFDFGALNMLAEALTFNYQVEEAREILEHTIQHTSEQTAAYRSLGQLQRYAFNRYDLAIQANREALAISPGFTLLNGSIADCYAELQAPELQKEWIQLFLDRAPRDDDVYFNMKATLHALRNEIEEARQAALQVAPGTFWFAGAAATLFYTSSSEEEQRYWMDELHKAFPQLTTTESSLNLNEEYVHALSLDMYHRLGDEAAVRQLAHRILISIPDKPEARRQHAILIVLAHALTGRTAEVVRELRTLIDQGLVINLTPSYPRDMFQTLHELMQDEPEFFELLSIMEERLAEQRTNLLRMESNGELAPLPEIEFENPI